MLDQSTTLLSTADGSRAYVIGNVRVLTHDGAGKLVYLARGGHAGVRIDGESVCHEWPIAQLKAVRS